jgi:hypothetical protein
VSASASAGASESIPTSESSKATTAAPVATSVPAQSQVAGPTTVAPPSVTASLQQNQAPFDLSTIALQSRVTVNLGKREAQPTQKRRDW